MNPPPQMSKEERREQIIQAAIACFSRKGYHLTTMDDIVAESGLSKGSLYWHFKNKKDVLFSVMYWYFDQVAVSLQGIVKDIPGASQKIQVLLDMFVRIFASDQPIINVFIDFYAESRHDEEVMKAIVSIMPGFIGQIAEVIQQGIDDGEFRAVDARQLAVGMMAAFDGLALYQMMLPNEVQWVETGRLFADIILHGLCAEEKD